MSEPPFRLPPPYDEPATLRPPVTDAAGHTSYVDIEVARVIGFRPLRMDVTVPVGVATPVPVVVWIHGGAFLMGSRRHGPVTELVTQALLDRGLAVAAVEYRLSGEALFPACLHDVSAAVRWLRRYGDALGLRPDAIGAWGESAGGHLAAFLGLNVGDAGLTGHEGISGVPSDVQAAVAWYPPTEFLTMDAQAGSDSAMPHDAADSPESRLVGGALPDRPDAAAYASPVTHVTASAAPMLLVHGESDRAVPADQSRALAAALERAGVSVELELVPGAGHVFLGVDPAPIALRSADFLAGRLR